MTVVDQISVQRKMIFGIISCIMCCIVCAEQEEERQRAREINRVRLAREAEIRRTDKAYQQRLRQHRQWQPQPPNRMSAGTRGSTFPAKLKSDPVPEALPSFTHSQRAPPRRAPTVTRRPSAEHEDGDEAEDTSEITPLV